MKKKTVERGERDPWTRREVNIALDHGSTRKILHTASPGGRIVLNEVTAVLGAYHERECGQASGSLGRSPTLRVQAKSPTPPQDDHVCVERKRSEKTQIRVGKRLRYEISVGTTRTLEPQPRRYPMSDAFDERSTKPDNRSRGV